MRDGYRRSSLQFTARLIGITGKAGAGKDTIADLCVKEFGAVKYNFALPIKQMINIMLGTTMGNWEDREWKEGGLDWLSNVSPRRMAQTLGTEWGRNLVDPDLWVKIAMLRFQHHADSGHRTPFIIPDVRFDNEAEAIHRIGGKVIRVVRPNVVSVAAHVSEAGVSDNLVDGTIVNDGTLDEFARNVLGRCDRWA